jgi:hypothetical protein
MKYKTTINMNPIGTALEYILREAIHDNKMELIQPSKEYTDLEVAYIKGYIQSLEDTLRELILLDKEDLNSVYSVCLN